MMGLFHQIQEMEFVVTDLHLYLDTHSCDQTALNSYNHALKCLDKITNEYTEEYGSLLGQGFHGYKHWNWLECPWPWEMWGW